MKISKLLSLLIWSSFALNCAAMEYDDEYWADVKSSSDSEYDDAIYSFDSGDEEYSFGHEDGEGKDNPNRNESGNENSEEEAIGYFGKLPNELTYQILLHLISDLCINNDPKRAEMVRTLYLVSNHFRAHMSKLEANEIWIKIMKAQKYVRSKSADKIASELFETAKHGNSRRIKFLIWGGADLLRNETGDTALIKAIRLNYKKVIKNLMLASVNLNAQAEDGDTPLIIAAREDKIVAKEMIKDGANPNAKNNVGDTALIVAAKKGYKQTVQFLLEANADVNIKNDKGNTALMQAAYENSKEIVQMLISANADLDIVNNDGKTALIVAKEKGYLEIGKMLSFNKIYFQAETTQNTKDWCILS